MLRPYVNCDFIMAEDKKTKQDLPKGFVDIMHHLLGDDADNFFEAMLEAPSVAVRINSRKPCHSFDGGQRVPWCEHGYYLQHRPVFTLDPLLHAGCYYVQDPSSMIYEKVVETLVGQFRKESVFPLNLSVLDLCAAPGGKTTAMINALPDGSHITANEFISKRAGVLRENLIKWGYPAVRVTNRDTASFAEEGETYDIIAVDAPCSGEGMMRKDKDAINQWSVDLIHKCAELQRKIIDNAIGALKPGGFLIYSTCTFNREENEENAEYISNEKGMIPFDLSFPKEWNIGKGINTNLPVYRFMPHLTKGEGLFLAVFRKDGCVKGIKGVKDVRDVKGVKEGEVPEIQDILSVDFNIGNYNHVDLTKEEALKYLRREALQFGEGVPKGIVIVTYEGHPLGAVKNIGNRANNLYPKSWRILMR